MSEKEITLQEMDEACRALKEKSIKPIVIDGKGYYYAISVRDKPPPVKRLTRKLPG